MLLTVEWLMFGIIFLAFFVHAVSGFGSALVAMPLLISIMGVSTAVPFFALLAQTAGIFLIFRYRSNWQWQAVWRVALGSLLMIPIGIWLAQTADEALVMTLLGIVIIAYSVYALAGMQLPELKNRNWGFCFGMMSGILHGAYNTGGPPLAIYANSQHWKPAEFKSNIQSLFLMNGVLTISTHAMMGNYERSMFVNLLIAIPVILLAQRLGFSLDKYVNPILFRKIILVLLIIIGLRMIF